MIEALPELDPNRICPACGWIRSPSNAPQMRYCRGVDTDERYKRDPCKLGIEPPHIHRRCSRCEFEWVESPWSEDTRRDYVDDTVPPLIDPIHYQCSACGFVAGDATAAKLRYCPGTEVGQQWQRLYCPWSVERAHLHVTCILCGYSWPMKALERPLVVGVAPEPGA